MSYNPNQPRKPAGTETGGEWTDDLLNIAKKSAYKAAGLSTENIITKYETHRNEIVTPLYNKLEELKWSIGENPANHYSNNAEYIEISTKYDEAIKISNAMYAEYKAATSTPEYKRAMAIEKIKKLGKIMNSKYAGKSSLNGKPFTAGEKIYYAKFGGVTYTVPISEMDEK